MITSFFTEMHMITVDTGGPTKHRVSLSQNNHEDDGPACFI
jgi:hypothetical protein